VKYSINLHRSLQLVSQDIHIHIESVKNPQELVGVAVGQTNHLTETGSWPMTPRAVVIPPTESIHPRVHLPGITVTSDPGWPTTIDTDTLMRCGVWWDGWDGGAGWKDSCCRTSGRLALVWGWEVWVACLWVHEMLFEYAWGPKERWVLLLRHLAARQLLRSMAPVPGFGLLWRWFWPRPANVGNTFFHSSSVALGKTSGS